MNEGIAPPVLRLLRCGPPARSSTAIFNPPEGQEGKKFKHVIQPSVTMQASARDRHVRPHRQAGVDRTTWSAADAVHLRPDQPALRQEGRRARSAVSCRSARPTTPSERGAVRSAVPEQLHRQRAPTPSSRRWRCRCGPRPTDRSAGGLPCRVGPDAQRAPTISANGTFIARQLAERIGRLEPAPVHRGSARASTIRTAPINTSTPSSTCAASRNRIGGTYTFNYDILRDRFLQQRWVAYYNAQCCGVGFEYQTFNLQGSLVRPGASGPPIQHLVHAGGHRHVLQSVRRVRRAAEPLTPSAPAAPALRPSAAPAQWRVRSVHEEAVESHA